MRYFEDLQIGETLSFGGLIVDDAEAEDFARRYDPECIPPPGIAYVHRGPRISPWQAAAMSWKLLSDLAATVPVEGAAFTWPGDIRWQNSVSVGDVLRVEAEVVEIFAPSPRFPNRGSAQVKVDLITTGPAGFGAWRDDDQELIDDRALTYFARLEARRHEEVGFD